MHKRTAFWLALYLSLVPSTVVAAKYDGSVPLLCAVIEVLECEAEAIAYYLMAITPEPALARRDGSGVP